MTKAAVSDWGFLRESDGYNRETQGLVTVL